MSDNAATPTSAHTRQEDRVQFWEKLSLGVGFLPLFFGNAAVKSLTIPVYQMTLKVDPVLLGLALALPRFWDALVDPFVGLMSDNCHSRWGRRKPFIFIGAVFQALAFGLIWMVPPTWGPNAILTYLIVTLVLFYTCFSFFSVPMMSLTYEMTPDYHERTRVSAFGGFFWKSGELISTWIFPLASSAALFGSVMTGVRSVGWILAGVVMGLCGVIPALFVRERFQKKTVKQEKVKLLPSLKNSFQNKAFVVLVLLTVCQVLAGMLTSSLDHYLLVYHMFGGDVAAGTHWKSVLTTGYVAVGILGIYPLNWLTSRIGKRAVLMLTFALVGAGAFGKWYLFTPGNSWKILLDPLLCAPVWIAISVLTPSMFADVCDDDELRHGQRREGMFGSLFSWIQKMGYSLAFFGSGIVLKLAGFDDKFGAHQPDAVIHNIRVVFTAATAAWALVALAILAFYPITAAKAYATRDALEARRGRGDVA